MIVQIKIYRAQSEFFSNLQGLMMKFSQVLMSWEMKDTGFNRLSRVAIPKTQWLRLTVFIYRSLELINELSYTNLICIQFFKIYLELVYYLNKPSLNIFFKLVKILQS